MQDLFRRITDEIVAAIEEGASDYLMPWHATGGMPVNAVTGQTYRGINALVLWAEARRSGYRSSKWATYKQWAQLDAYVAKGELSTVGLFWKPVGSPENNEEQTGEKKLCFIARSFRLFNAEQVDGFLDKPTPALSEDARHQAAEQFFAALPANVWLGSDQAFYDPSSDTISMPAFEAFKTAAGYYGVLAHEFVHWTGAKHRLDRNLAGRFGSDAYAAEELIAELGSAFLMGQLGLSSEPREDHAPYVASWLRVLNNDPRAIITAASQAQAAVEYLLGCAGTKATAAEQAEPCA